MMAHCAGLERVDPRRLPGLVTQPIAAIPCRPGAADMGNPHGHSMTALGRIRAIAEDLD
jgi:hypothetical protein